MNILDTLDYVKTALNAPFHYFNRNANNTLTVLSIEDATGTRYTFTGFNATACVHEAESYIKAEIAAGSIVIEKPTSTKDKENVDDKPITADDKKITKKK